MILAFDTSTKVCSVALYDGKNFYKKEDNTPMKHSVSLMVLIDDILKENSFKISDVEKIIVAIGPGSYTGIRVGLSCAFGLSDGLDIEIYGVSSLRAISYEKENSCAVIDARRGYVYAACYDDEFYDEYILAEDLKNRYSDKVFLGEGLENIFNSNYINASANAINLIRAYNDGFYVSDVEANYIRLHEAQRKKMGK